MTKYIVDLLKLSFPILIGNLAQILVGIIDTITAGQYSTVALGSISVASAIVMTVTIGAIGFVLSVSPVISNLKGQNIGAKKYFKPTIKFALLISVPFFLILELILLNIDSIGLSPDMVPYVKQYIGLCAWTIFPSTVFVSVKEFLQAYENVKFANFLMIFMVVINAILNYILTFTLNLGVLGLSIATVLSKTLSCILILIYCFSLFKEAGENSKDYIKSLIKVGGPISLAIFFEFLGFNLTAVLIGKFNSLFVAVHNIVLCIANFSYMISLSFSNAVSVKIGFYNGRKDKKNIIKYSFANMLLIIAVCSVTFLILIFYSENILYLFSRDTNVILLSKKILIYVICFLFFDGIQCGCSGILKGLKDTKIIMATMLLAYILIAIPLGSYLAFAKNIVLEGFWLALSLAILTAALVTGSRVIYKIINYDKL